MKKAFFLLVMVLLIITGYSQEIVKYRTLYYSLKNTSGDGPYEWTARKPVSVLVVNSAKRTIVYTSIEQNYDYIGETPSLIYTDTSLNTAWKAIDQKGLPCILELQVDKGNTTLYIIYEHIQIAYDLKKVQS